MEPSVSSDSGISPAGGTVSAAVQEHLRQLCLREFPCGTGSWNKSRFLPQTWRTWRELVPREEETVSAGEETVEALLGLVRSHHSPWALLKGSSAEDSFLRELAIQSPLMIKDTFFYSYFRSLRVVDKGVNLVDRDLLKFLNLEELVLSANKIMEIDATNLPPTLKVLELYGNLITSMKCLCTPPPPRLQHLGVGHNKLLGSLESLYVTSNHWPHLVSLDLGFNDLTDLQGMVASLRTLQYLRLLVLQGNPLALVPYYRGFTIDSLAGLCVLDDVTVTPNEKHQFRGLIVNGDLLAREAQFVVTIGNIRGVMDTSVLDPEPGPEGPFITYSYYVTYDFVKDEEAEGTNEPAEVDPDSVLTEIVNPTFSTEVLDEEVVQEEVPREPGREAHREERAEEEREEAAEEVPEQVAEEMTDEMAEGSLESGVTELGESESSVISVHSAPLPQSIDSSEELSKLRPRIDAGVCSSPGTVLFSTAHKPWEDVISCDYEMQHTLKDLVPVKAFLLSGTTVSIVEEKILSWPLVPPPVEVPLPGKKGKGENDKRKEKDKKGKVEELSKDRKGVKKKKELPKELRQDPPVLTVIGSGLVVLEPLLVGEPMVSTVCNFGVVRTLESDKLTNSRDSKKIKKTVKKEKSRSAVALSESVYEPEPLTVEVTIQLIQCRSAEEALHSLVA